MRRPRPMMLMLRSIMASYTTFRVTMGRHCEIGEGRGWNRVAAYEGRGRGNAGSYGRAASFGRGRRNP